MQGSPLRSSPMRSLRKMQGDLTSGPHGELLVTAPVLARWLGVNGKAVYDLAKAGILVRFSRDHFLLEDSVRHYCDHVRSLPNLESAETKQARDP